MQSWDELDNKWGRELGGPPEPPEAEEPTEAADRDPYLFFRSPLSGLVSSMKTLVSAKGLLLWFGGGAVLLTWGGIELDGGSWYRGPNKATNASAVQLMSAGLALIGVGVLVGLIVLVRRNRPE